MEPSAKIADGYYHSKNQIYLNKLEDEIETPKIVFPIDYVMPPSQPKNENGNEPIHPKEYLELEWGRVAIEEVLHEFEHKCLTPQTVSSEALELHGRFVKQFFPPERHGPAFFEAIVLQAGYFGISGEELASYLSGRTLPNNQN